MALTQQAMDKIGSILSTGTPQQKFATTKYLQENLSAEDQALLLSYFESSTAAPAEAVDPIAIDATIDIPETTDVTQYGIDTQEVPDLTADSGSLGSVNLSDEYDALAMEAAKVTKQFLSGQLAPSTLSQLESVSGEKSLAAGLGTGSASRNLTARDIGMTVEQLQEKGLAATPSIAGLFETKRQFNIGMKYSTDTFNKEFSLKQAEYQNNVRALALQGEELRIEAESTNAEIALELNKMILDSWKFSQELAFKYRTTKGDGGDVDTSGLEADSASIMSDLSALIG